MEDNKSILLKQHSIEFNMSKDIKKSGRTYIKMTALLVHNNTDEYNENGITWLEEYVRANLESAIDMSYNVEWLNEEEQIPKGHGEINFDDDGEIGFDGVTVGSVKEAYIDTIEIDGVMKKVLVTEGYIHNQRYGKLVKFLKEQLASGKIYGSIEITGKGDSKEIVYANGKYDDDGYLKMGRAPSVFDFSGLAIMFMTEPADTNSQVLEINKNIKNNNEEETDVMDYKVEYEKAQARIAELEGQESEKEINAMQENIQGLEADVQERDNKIAELNEAIITANKEVEAKKEAYDKLEVECNGYKEQLNVIADEKATAELNAYWEEVKQNGFEESELNELKEQYFDKGDLDGLKAAEAVICMNKFKAMKKSVKEEKDVDAETNSAAFNFFAVNKTEKKSVKEDEEFNFL